MLCYNRNMTRQKNWLKRVFGAIATGVLVVANVGPVVLAEDVVDQKILDNISQDCGSIKQSLADLQRADSRTRTYLGSAYESVARDFITPLNLRLVKNNQVNTKLFEIQASFSSQQADFRTEYTAYMRELESLIAMDCQKHPQEFYRQLEKTREHRTKLHNLAESLSKLVTEQYQGVAALREVL